MLEETAQQGKLMVACWALEWFGAGPFNIGLISSNEGLTPSFVHILLPLEAMCCEEIDAVHILARLARSRFEMDDHAGEGGKGSLAAEAVD